jgi:hypothetical protein
VRRTLENAGGSLVLESSSLRKRLNGIIGRYLDVQPDILETFVDRDQFLGLTQPTLLPDVKRIPGLKFDQDRRLALLHSLVRLGPHNGTTG